MNKHCAVCESVQFYDDKGNCVKCGNPEMYRPMPARMTVSRDVLKEKLLKAKQEDGEL